MMAIHSLPQHDAFRPSNPMSIRSMLNDNDYHSKVQRPLPPIIMPGEDSDSMTHQSSQFFGYRPYAYGSVSSGSTSPTMSSASSASRRGSVARAPRPKYSDDQGYFIWYHRTDLAEPWDKVLQEFAKQFNHRRPKGGLQCKFYRLLGDWGVEKVREQARQSQSRSRDSVGRYGLVQRTNIRYEWMRPEHVSAPQLPQFATGHPNSPGGSPCPGCDECIAARSR